MGGGGVAVTARKLRYQNIKINARAATDLLLVAHLNISFLMF